jgi:hypothetical protein
MRWVVLAAIFLLSISLGAPAQTQGQPVRGVSQFTIKLDELDSNSVRCGLTEDGIRKAILYPASSARFQMSDSAITDFSVSLSTLYFERADACVTDILVVVRSYQTGTLKAVWTRSIHLSGARSGYQQRSLQAIEDLTRDFVIDWNLANK